MRHRDDSDRLTLQKALELRSVVDDSMPQHVRDMLKPLLDAVFAPSLVSKGDVCTATITIKNFGRVQFEALFDGLVTSGIR